MTNRAKRRDQKERAKRRVRAYDICKGPAQTPKRIGRVARTPKPCSCHMCGNPRKWWEERTLQEYRQDQEPVDNY